MFGFLTTTSTKPAACAPVEHVMLVAETTAGDEQTMPPTVTVAPVKNPAPVMVIAVPPVVEPDAGDTDVTAGVISPDVITRLPLPFVATATKRPLTYVTEVHGLLAADVWIVHVIPSGLVITRLSEPLVATATKRPLPKVTEVQLLSLADAWLVHVIPSGLVMTRLPLPVLDTATNLRSPSGPP